MTALLTNGGNTGAVQIERHAINLNHYLNFLLPGHWLTSRIL